MTAMTEKYGTGSPRRPRPRAPFTWNRLLWAIVYPQHGDTMRPTMPGGVLVGLSLGIGTAAYNSSSNILFITLSLLLACLILSGLLSWINLRGVSWDLVLAPPLRAGHDAVVAIELRNAKSFLPTYGLWFEVAVRALDPTGAALRAESTVTARGKDVRAALAEADRLETTRRLALSNRLDPQGQARLEWIYKPTQRGLLRVRLLSVGSLFPFGFLRKEIGANLITDVIVWPAPVSYQKHPVAAVRRISGGERVPRVGVSGDLLALRRYTMGDSHRLIHWKASARTGQLLVQQFTAENAEGYALWLRTDAGVWPRPDQFELLVGFAGTLAEDLFRGGRLLSVAIDGEPPAPIRRVHDLELFLDKLATLRPTAETLPGGDTPVAKRNVLTFLPDGQRGIAAHVDGQRAAAV